MCCQKTEKIKEDVLERLVPCRFCHKLPLLQDINFSRGEYNATVYKEIFDKWGVVDKRSTAKTSIRCRECGIHIEKSIFVKTPFNSESFQPATNAAINLWNSLMTGRDYND